ncbi:MAG: 5-dehydro-4-deoxyglucarate dehydratase [Gammaproteobacteria bacterium]|nr:5-dehydro-4-deoxyglucarate dehydratase [Gammaproteobacteria bacterium]
MTPDDLKICLSSGLLSFPITDFHANGDFNAKSYADRLNWLQPYGAQALFVAGGTGEFFSLVPEEYSDLIQVAHDTCHGRTPIIAGVGGNTRLAMQFAKRAAVHGADGLLLFPHYLTEASQEGLCEHFQHICQATPLGVIVYNRGPVRLTAESLQKLANHNPNLIGFKDGIGDLELMVSIQSQLGERLTYIGGLPTAEIFAGAYKAIGCPVYSSAVFNFVPKLAMQFYQAHALNDTVTCANLLKRFFLPLIKIRHKGAGYAVSLIKAGAEIVGHSAGPIRPPLTALKAEEYHELAKLIESVAD